jgi:hypothetical protein
VVYSTDMPLPMFVTLPGNSKTMRKANIAGLLILQVAHIWLEWTKRNELKQFYRSLRDIRV